MHSNAFECSLPNCIMIAWTSLYSDFIFLAPKTEYQNFSPRLLPALYNVYDHFSSSFNFLYINLFFFSSFWKIMDNQLLQPNFYCCFFLFSFADWGNFATIQFEREYLNAHNHIIPIEHLSESSICQFIEYLCFIQPTNHELLLLLSNTERKHNLIVRGGEKKIESNIHGREQTNNSNDFNMTSDALMSSDKFNDFLLATVGIDNITSDKVTSLYGDNLNVTFNWFDNNISTTIQPSNSSREFHLFGSIGSGLARGSIGGLDDDESLKKDFVFDRTDVRVIFITLYSLVFCCCFLGKHKLAIICLLIFVWMWIVSWNWFSQSGRYLLFGSGQFRMECRWPNIHWPNSMIDSNWLESYSIC